MPPTRLLRPGLLFVLIALSGCGWLWWKAVRSENFYFLPPSSNAQWLIYPTPADGPPKWGVELSTQFRRTFVLAADTANKPARLRLRVSLLPELRDVDNPEDLDVWRRAQQKRMTADDADGRG